jgi:hypothetical protein
MKVAPVAAETVSSDGMLQESSRGEALPAAVTPKTSAARDKRADAD